MAYVNKEAVDWAFIEKHYRAGIWSNMVICEEAAKLGFKITEAGIRKRAKRDNWERDLKAKIQQRAEAIVRRKTAKPTLVDSATEQEIVEANATAAADVLMEHKSHILRARELFSKLLAEVCTVTNNLELFERLGEMLDESGKNDAGRNVRDKLNEMYRSVISMDGRVENAGKLTAMLEKLVKLERQAWGISDDENKSGSAVDALLKKINSED